MSRDQLPLTVGALTAVAAVIVLAVAGYLGVVLPAQREIARLERELSATAPTALVAAPVEAVSDAERAAWRATEGELRDRFVPLEDQRRALVDVGRLARTHGLAVADLRLSDGAEALPGPAAPGQEPAPAALSAVVSPLPYSPPPPLAVNPLLLRLVVRGQFAQLATFLGDVGRRSPYLALHALDVRRVDGQLESDVRLASLRLEEPR